MVVKGCGAWHRGLAALREYRCPLPGADSCLTPIGGLLFSLRKNCPLSPPYPQDMSGGSR